MILTCPACQTSYTVKDGAIPPQGRTVRCAACKHSWHQQGEVVVVPSAAVAEPEAAPENETSLLARQADAPAAEADDVPVMSEEAAPIPGSVAKSDEVAAAEAITEPESTTIADDSGWNDAPYDDDEVAPRRKGPLVILALVLIVAVIAAAAYFFAPREWMARAGLAEVSADSPLKLMVTSQNRQKLASGNDLVSLSGRVINPTDRTEPVPALQADLRDGGGKLVYSWMIPPPAARLAPRASASFNAAELGVPANATSLTLRWAS